MKSYAFVSSQYLNGYYGLRYIISDGSMNYEKYTVYHGATSRIDLVQSTTVTTTEVVPVCVWIEGSTLRFGSSSNGMNIITESKFNVHTIVASGVTEGLALTYVGGLPVIVYATSSSLHLLVGQSALPTNAGEWNTYDITPGGSTISCRGISIIEKDSTTLLLTMKNRTDNKLYYGVITTSGVSTYHDVISVGTTGAESSMGDGIRIWQNVPVIITTYNNGTTRAQVIFLKANNETPTSSSDWVNDIVADTIDPTWGYINNGFGRACFSPGVANNATLLYGSFSQNAANSNINIFTVVATVV